MKIPSNAVGSRRRSQAQAEIAAAASDAGIADIIPYRAPHCKRGTSAFSADPTLSDIYSLRSTK